MARPTVTLSERKFAVDDVSIKTFIDNVTQYYRKHGRHGLPWRRTTDPYKILVSEIMLQQTQVDRVIPYYESFLKEFATIEDLARSNLGRVLKLWSGLGYNRRAKMLRDCAQEIVEKRGGIFPRSRKELESLPGIGPYTAGAVRAFAFNESDVFIETNIRTVLLHHFFPRSKQVNDAQLLRILEKYIRHVRSPREWYAALMDYGAHLKKEFPNPSRRSKHHVKQSKFEGSVRQLRGAVLRVLSIGPTSKTVILSRCHLDSTVAGDLARLDVALGGLARDKLIRRVRGVWRIL